jgi:shikimate kinase
MAKTKPTEADQEHMEVMNILMGFAKGDEFTIASALDDMADALDEGSAMAVQHMSKVLRFCSFLTDPDRVMKATPGGVN